MQISNSKESFLERVCNEIKYKPIRDNVANEIKNHIEEEKENYLIEGINEEMAEEKTILNMGDPKNIGKYLNRIHRPKLDIKLLIISLITVFFGLLITYSLSNMLYKNNIGSNSWFYENIIYIIFSGLLGTIIYFYDYTKLQKRSWIVYLFSTIIGILSISMNFQNSNSSYIYIPIFNINILTANIIVLLYIIGFSGFINNFNLNIKSNVVLITILSLFSLLVVCYCNSLIYLIILFSAYISIFMIEIFKSGRYNKKYKLVSSIIFTFTAIVITLVFLLSYSPYKIEVAKTTLNPSNNEYSNKYQMSIREDILEKSQMFGVNKLQGNLSDELKLSDWAYGLQDAEGTESFVFIIGNYGIIFGVIVVVCILYLLLQIITNAKNIKDLYGKYIIIGIATMIIIQSTMHILSNLCIIIPNSANLPLVSYSNSSMIINIITLSIILCIYRRKDIIVINSNK